jgi:hypothetical protein
MSRLSWTVIGIFMLSLSLRARAAEEAKPVKLVNVETGKVLAVTDDSEDAGAKAVLAKDEPTNEARQWKLEKDGSEYKVVNRKTGKVLDVFQNSKDEGGQIIQWDEKTEDNANQRWSWEGTGEERRLKSKNSGLVLDVETDGSVVQKKSDPKAKSQLWRVVEVK